MKETVSMNRGVFDVESDGFLRELTHLHCLVIQDYDTLEVWAYHDHPDEFQPCDGGIADGIGVLNNLDTTIAHNQKNFDILAMEKCRSDYSPKEGQVAIDSLALSRLLFPEMRKDSIEAWAIKLKLDDQKIQNDDWSHLNQNMLNRCISDVKINTQVIKHLWEIVDKQEAEGTKWYDALMCEQEVLYIHGKQTLHGVVYDSALAHETLDIFDAELLSLRDRITEGAPPVMSVPGVTGQTLEDYRKVSTYSFAKPFNLHQGVKQPFRKVKYKTIAKPFKKSGNLKVQAKKVFEGVDYPWSQIHTVRGPFSCWYPLTIEEKFSAHVISWFSPEDLLTVGGPFSKIEFKPININASQQVKDLLYSLGWKPDEWNSKKLPDGSFIRRSPKLSESSFGSLPPGLGQDVKIYRTIKHRRSSIQSITSSETKGALSKVRDDGRVPAEAVTCGTPTARYRHSGA